jgi:hypothetical protein
MRAKASGLVSTRAASSRLQPCFDAPSGTGDDPELMAQDPQRLETVTLRDFPRRAQPYEPKMGGSA